MPDQEQVMSQQEHPVCDHCGEQVPGPWHAVGDEVWCEGCVDNDAINCALCLDLVDFEHAHVVLDGERSSERWCQDCFDAEAAMCSRCEEWVHGDNTTAVCRGRIGREETWCDTCATDHASACSRCDALTPSSDLIAVGEDAEWCERCVNSYSTVCNCCEETVDADETYYADGSNETVCQACWEEHYCTCENCEETYHDDLCFYRDDHDACLCDGCAEDDAPRQREESAAVEDVSPVVRRRRPIHPEMANRPIQSYNWRPELQGFTFFMLPHERLHNGVPTFGIEIELETPHLDPGTVAEQFLAQDRKRIFYAKHDGSIADGGYPGFEAVTMPFTWGWLKDNLDVFDVVEHLRTLGCRSYDTTSCGMHVHIGRQSFSNNGGTAKIHLIKFATFLFSHYEFIHYISRRRPSDLARWAAVPASGSYHYAKGLVYREDTPPRYSALNLRRQDTAECRIFRGTLNKRGIFANLEFLHALLEYTRGASWGKLDPLSFSEWVTARSHQYRNLMSVLGNRLMSASAAI